MKLLNEIDIKEKLNKISGWDFIENSIRKDYKMKDFSNALAFILKIGIQAEKMDHHPDLLLYGWNNVKVTLSTHSAGGVTENDFNLAQQIEKIYS